MEIPLRAVVALYLEAQSTSPQIAAQALLPAFVALRRAGLDTFFLKARSRRRAEARAFLPSVESLVDLLAQGVNRRDLGGEAIPELGFSASVWSGGPDDEAFSLSIRVGSISPHAKNYFLLDLPASGPYALHRRPGEVQSLFAELVEVLRPTQGVVCEPNAIRWDGGSLSAHIPSLVRYGTVA